MSRVKCDTVSFPELLWVVGRNLAMSLATQVERRIWSHCNRGVVSKETKILGTLWWTLTCCDVNYSMSADDGSNLQSAQIWSAMPYENSRVSASPDPLSLCKETWLMRTAFGVTRLTSQTHFCQAKGLISVDVCLSCEIARWQCTHKSGCLRCSSGVQDTQSRDQDWCQSEREMIADSL